VFSLWYKEIPQPSNIQSKRLHHNSHMKQLLLNSQ
jgi:hypothetical protein